ncbi:basic secretory family protein [Luteolibacter sp. GHJ8]|uniref:Basic secretory family protein n=1 Tax=Luteolibacter rhizosphaerae TaxID=2989719 RepID=A0ABT3G707_9BACT|nr:basic secretory family protein [Luteolibacter rhizosphaerae]MCW1915641.1 basic secretory family protein [Luteolibacter rhizosphaerae]
MKSRFSLATLLLVSTVCADPAVKVTTGFSATDAGFKSGGIRPPAMNDAGKDAFFRVVSGKADEACGVLPVVKDGRGPSNQDDPEANFFFANGDKGGRLSVELKAPIEVKDIATYSWHTGARAPQIYKLYAADGTAPGFNAEPAAEVDPATAGWKLVAEVDTRKNGEAGQHSVLISTEGGEPLGKYSRLLFDVAANDNPHGQGNTFFSEIDITDAKGPALQHFEKKVETFTSKDGKFKYVLNSSESPDLHEWAKVHLMPVMEDWYPKLIEMIPVDGYTPPDTINFTMKLATTLPGHAQGVPAFASGNNVTLNANFMRDQQGGEAIGCAIHEIVHVVQFGSPGGSTRGQRPPTWVTEGVADYIRWFLFEPQAKGAEITQRNFASANYDSSYRITANFYDFVIKKYEKDLMKKLNLATHQGYSEDLWKQWTGKTVQELDAEWKAANKERLGIQ